MFGFEAWWKLETLNITPPHTWREALLPPIESDCFSPCYQTAALQTENIRKLHTTNGSQRFSVFYRPEQDSPQYQEDSIQEWPSFIQIGPPSSTLSIKHRAGFPSHEVLAIRSHGLENLQGSTSHQGFHVQKKPSPLVSYCEFMWIWWDLLQRKLPPSNMAGPASTTAGFVLGKCKRIFFSGARQGMLSCFMSPFVDHWTSRQTMTDLVTFCISNQSKYPPNIL